MHSKIIQISRNKIPEDERTIDDDYYYDGFSGWFVPSVADYVTSMDEEEQKRAMENLNAEFVSIDPKARKMTILSKEKYFEQPYKMFLDAAARCSKASFEEFMRDYNDLRAAWFKVCWTYEDKHSIYVDLKDGDGLMTWDAFLRMVNNGDVFYIGSVLGYHF